MLHGSTQKKNKLIELILVYYKNLIIYSLFLESVIDYFAHDFLLIPACTFRIGRILA